MGTEVAPSLCAQEEEEEEREEKKDTQSFPTGRIGRAWVCGLAQLLSTKKYPLSIYIGHEMRTASIVCRWCRVVAVVVTL